MPQGEQVVTEPAHHPEQAGEGPLLPVVGGFPGGERERCQQNCRADCRQVLDRLGRVIRRKAPRHQIEERVQEGIADRQQHCRTELRAAVEQREQHVGQRHQPDADQAVARAVGVETRTAQAAFFEAPRAASATAAPTSDVLALPFMSGVRGPSRMTRSIARTMSAAACGCPRCSSISAPDQIVAMGLAILLPAMSGAEPCTGSKMEGAVRSGLIFPEAAMPMVPAVAGPRSERMSPKRFEATMTSKRSGLSTIWMVRPSTWYWSVRTSGYCLPMAAKRSSQYGMVMVMPFDLVHEVRCFLRVRDSSKAYRMIRSTPLREKMACCITTSRSVPS